MESVPISKFKATCLSVVDEVHRTHKRITITRHGRPVAELGPVRPPRQRHDWLGCMAGTAIIKGNLVKPVSREQDWSTDLP